MKKGRWSKEEDELMKKHIEKYGIGRSWQALAETLGLRRCGRSCRSRWLNYLRPGLKHGNFTPAEETIIYEMYSKWGSSWSFIAAQLPGRTDLAVKNYWHSTLAKRLAGASAAAHRRRLRPSASTTSDATKPGELALVTHDEESATTGSSCHGSGMVNTLVLAADQLAAVQPLTRLATAAGNVAKGEVGEAAWAARKPAVARALLLENAPAPPGDRAGAMEMICATMSPIPLAFMEPDLPCTAGSFDEIDSFLPWFDDWYSN